jgi:hypothetical protein
MRCTTRAKNAARHRPTSISEPHTTKGAGLLAKRLLSRQIILLMAALHDRQV